MVWFCERCGSENLDNQKDCKDCKEERKPYYRKSLSEPKVIRDQFTVEVNPQERAWLEVLKARLDFKSDSQVMKLCLENAIIGGSLALSEASWRYVLRSNRQRLSSFKKLPEPSPKENAMQK